MTPRAFATIVLIAGAGLTLFSWIAHNVREARRDGVSDKAGIVAAGNGCGTLLVRSGLIIVAVAIGSMIFSAVPSCSRHRTAIYRR